MNTAFALLLPSSVLIILATLVSTVWLPSIDKEINALGSELDGFYGQRERLILTEIHNRQSKIKNRINLVELNLHKSDKEFRTDELMPFFEAVFSGERRTEHLAQLLRETVDSYVPEDATAN